MSTKTDDETQLDAVELPAEILEAVARQRALRDEARQLDAQAMALMFETEAKFHAIQGHQCPAWCTVEARGDKLDRTYHQWHLTTGGAFALVHSGTRKRWVIEAREFIESNGAHWISRIDERGRAKA